MPSAHLEGFDASLNAHYNEHYHYLRLMASYPVPIINVAGPDELDANNNTNEPHSLQHDSSFPSSEGENVEPPSNNHQQPGSLGLSPAAGAGDNPAALPLLRVPSAASAAYSTDPSSEGPHTPSATSDAGSFHIELASPSPSHSELLSHNTTKLRENDPNAKNEGKGSIALLQPRAPHSRQLSFSSNDGSAEGTEPDHGPVTPIEPRASNAISTTASDSEKHEDAAAADTRPKLDPSQEAEVPRPFTIQPLHLASSLDPKNLQQIHDWGGSEALLASLGTDATRGLRASSGGQPSPHVPNSNGNNDGKLSRVLTGEKATPGVGGAMRTRDDSGSQPPGTGGKGDPADDDVYAVSLEQRQAAYGANILPDRKSKSLFQLMWIALQDRVLVSVFLSRFFSFFYFGSPHWRNPRTCDFVQRRGAEAVWCLTCLNQLGVSISG